MINQMEIKKRLLSKQKKQEIDEYVIRAHHVLMKEYGWIPLEEFRNLPIITIQNLLSEIQSDWEEERKAIEKARMKSKVK